MRVRLNGSNVILPVSDSRQFIRDLVTASFGRFIGITFKRTRSTGEEKTLNGQIFADTLGDKDTKNDTITLVSVNDERAGRGRYRSVPIEGITRITLGGQTFDFLP